MKCGKPFFDLGWSWLMAYYQGASEDKSHLENAGPRFPVGPARATLIGGRNAVRSLQVDPRRVELFDRRSATSSFKWRCSDRSYNSRCRPSEDKLHAELNLAAGV